MLPVGMASVKMGDQIALIGCADGGRLGAIAAKVGLSGRAAAFLPDEASAARARKGAAANGVLVEVDVTPTSRLPAEDAAFNIVIVDDTGGLLATMNPDERTATVREALRILKRGGRMMVIGSVPRTGLSALLSRSPGGPQFNPQPTLEAGGFKFVRVLGEREGLRFVEGLKPR
jgi:hypothetical protein